MALEIADIVDERQGAEITILDVTGPLAIADYFVIATIRNPRHGQGLARELAQFAKASSHPARNLAGHEGESRWILIDLDEVVVHLFLAQAREFYALESLWSDVPRVDFQPQPRRAPAGDSLTTAARQPVAGWSDSMDAAEPSM